MHNPISMTTGKKGLAAKQIPTPEDEAAAGRYLDEHDNFQIPAMAVKKCIVSGAKGMRIAKQAATSVLMGTVFPAEEWYPLLDVKTLKPMKGDRYVIDTRRVVVDGNGIMRSRPKITGWACKVSFELDDLITDEVVLECLSRGGPRIGILDYRPQKSGWFGRFTAQLLAEKPINSKK
jgi:hypothetical protein